jgi:tetratricopeptide (TPR) repeat protein
MSVPNLPGWIVDKIQSGDAVLFLGAGAIKGAVGRNGSSALSANELKDKLSDRFLSGKQKDKSLVQVADYAKYESSIPEVQCFIKSLFEELEPADFHFIIPTFRWRAIITTNYDLVIERTYDKSRDRLQNLAVIIRDGDKFLDKTRDPRTVPYLKLHGCINVCNDTGLPLILGSEEYAKYSFNRKRLFQHFAEWGRECPIIFCGYNIGDPNIQTILFDLSDININRPQYVIANPSLNEFDMRMWAARRFNPIRCGFKEFLETIDSEIPKHSRDLISPTFNQNNSIARFLINSSSSPSIQLLRYIDAELEHIWPGMAVSSRTPKDYYRGLNDSWGPYSLGLDIRRKITDDIISDVILDSPPNNVHVSLVKGFAGSGKSAVLRRFAWDAANHFDALVFWLKEGAVTRQNLIKEIFELTGKRVTFVIEDVVRDTEDIVKLIDFSNRQGIKINIVMGARSNEWNLYCDDIARKVDNEYELRNLSEKEIDELIGKLDKHNCLGEMKNKTLVERHNYFKLTADRQLLVALHEATLGKPLEDILLDEYNNITPLEAQILYLDICSLDRFGVGVRAGLISRVSEIRFEDFNERLFKPLEHVVRTVFDSKDRDYLYKTRHPKISEIVFSLGLPTSRERVAQIVRMIKCLNVDYYTDRIAFGEIIKGKLISELFSDRAFAEEIFKAALESSASKSHIYHQKAVFELHHPNGDLNKALEAIKKTDNDGENYSIEHTKALILKKMAQNSISDIEKEVYRNNVKTILQKQVNIVNTSHSINTLAEVYLDEINERLLSLSGEEVNIDPLSQRVLLELVHKVEDLIRNGLNRFPSDSYLLSTEAKLTEILENKEKAYKILEKAFNSNPSSGYLAVRLSKYYFHKGEVELSLTFLRKCLDENPSCREVHLQLALILILSNEENHKDDITRHLRSSFTDGDSNHESQFWFARHNFLYGDRKKAFKIFESLKKNRFPIDLRNKIRGYIKDAQGNNKVFHGNIKTLTDIYCFVACAELGTDIYIHNNQFKDKEWDDAEMYKSLTFFVAFNLFGPIGANARY